VSLSGVDQFHGFAGSARIGLLKLGHMTNSNIAEFHVHKPATPAAGRTSTFGIVDEASRVLAATKTNTLVYGKTTRRGYNPHCVATMVTF
jgi:hypothetical protein